MYSVFHRVDETLRQRKTPAGSTGVVCLILESWIVTANVGDSRAILVREEGSARRQSTISNRINTIEGSIDKNEVINSADD